MIHSPTPRSFFMLLATLLAAVIFLPAQPAVANGTTFVVNSTAHRVDANPGDGICDTGEIVTINGVNYPECTLRAAIDEANTTPALDNIHFDIRNADGTCPSLTAGNARRITVPNINAPNYVPVYTYKGQAHAAFPVTRPVNIDGYTQCGASPNSQADGSNTAIRIELRGASTNANYPGIALWGNNSSGSTIRGISFSNFGRGHVAVVHSGNHTIAGNFFGQYANGNSAGGQIGVFLFYGTYNVIGGSTLADRNIVAGLGNDGVHFEIGSSYNHIIGNYFGMQPNGINRRGNGSDMIDFQAGATHNWIGGIMLDAQGNPILDENGRTIADPNKRNILAGGTGDAIEMGHPTPNGQNHIVGNWIGLNAFGNALGNGEDGINIEDHFNNNYIYQNIIVNNGSDGIVLWAADGNHIFDNWIGVRPAGETLGGTPFDFALMGNGPTGRNIHGSSVSKGVNGIYMIGGSDNNIIERNHIADNGLNSLESSSGRGYGIFLSAERGWIREPDPEDPNVDPEDASATCSHQRNIISQNSIYGNHHFRGIRLVNGADCPFMQAFGMQPPVLVGGATSSNTHMITATSLQKIKDGNGVYQDVPCANCVIELFVNSDVVGAQGVGVQGKTYVTSATTDSTGKAIFVLTPPLPSGTELVATARDPLGNTSEFSATRTVNAPSCASAPTAVSPTIAKAGNNVQLSWSSVSGAQFYRVYRDTAANFTPSSANLVAQINSGTSYTDVDALANNDSSYYAVIAVNHCVQESAATNRVGEVVLVIKPNWSMITLPIMPAGTHVQDIFSNQMLGTGYSTTADWVQAFDGATQNYNTAWYCAGECEDWGAPWANNWLQLDYNTSNLHLTPGQGFWVLNRSAENKYVKLVGNVLNSGQNVSIHNNWNMIGSTAATPRTLAELNLPATGASSSRNSNFIRYWNHATQSYQEAWFCTSNCGNSPVNSWVDTTPQKNPSTIVIQPGDGFWYRNVTNGPFTWPSH